MRRIAFRRILPIVQLVLSIALLFAGHARFEVEAAKLKGTWLAHSTALYHIENPAIEMLFAINAVPAILSSLVGLLSYSLAANEDLSVVEAF